MRLLEYEAKQLLRQAHILVPSGKVISDASSLVPLPVVLKSQVPVGGRGKQGGVKIVDTAGTFRTAVQELLSLSIEGHTPSVLLAEEKISITAEHYLSLSIDRSSSTIRLMAHRAGGVEIESHDSSKFFITSIDSETIKEASARLANYLQHKTSLIKPLLTRLYDVFIKNDAILLEINPLIYTSENTLVCGDCKMELDDAAAFRHPEWDFNDTPADANFVVLDKKGSVATVANGAGLAMATVDAVVAHGMKPANFLDIGGGATAESVLAAFKKIMTFPDVNVIIINIFAGITRCDEIAKAIIAAKSQLPDIPPLFIRLAGTNFEQAVSLLAAENIPTLGTLEECLTEAKRSIYG